jgi:membrane associated rhomboid family serine protease
VAVTPRDARDAEREASDAPEPALREILFPKRGLSATELLILANVLVFAALAAAWRADYLPELRHLTRSWWVDVRERGAYGWFLPTIFMHAGFGHLAGNLTALLAASGAVEFLTGSRGALATYLIAGFGASWLSYVGHGGPPLSVGASGAIFGLLGCAVSFIVRRRAAFSYAQRWKVGRVYLPLFVLLYLPVLAKADVHAHAGGFACGLLLGLLLPPHPRLARLAAADPMREEAAEPGEEGD